MKLHHASVALPWWHHSQFFFQMHWLYCVVLGVHSKPSGPRPSECGPAQLKRSDFSSSKERCALCFPTLVVPELVMCKLFKIYLSSLNVRCLKFNTGLWKWMSNFSLRRRGEHICWNFGDPRLYFPAIWTARILKWSVIYHVFKQFCLTGQLFSPFKFRFESCVMFDYFCWMYTASFLRRYLVTLFVLVSLDLNYKIPRLLLSFFKLCLEIL